MSLNVNGRHVVVDAPANERLVDTLRERLQLRGTKAACGTGECGACTVLVDGEPVLSCLVLTARLRAAETIETVEGVRDETRELREALADCGGYQCGYCTPGQVVTGAALLRAGLPPSDEDLRQALSGNICRCTGYQGIVAALRQAEARGATPP